MCCSRSSSKSRRRLLLWRQRNCSLLSSELRRQPSPWQQLHPRCLLPWKQHQRRHKQLLLRQPWLAALTGIWRQRWQQLGMTWLILLILLLTQMMTWHQLCSQPCRQSCSLPCSRFLRLCCHHNSSGSTSNNRLQRSRSRISCRVGSTSSSTLWPGQGRRPGSQPTRNFLCCSGSASWCSLSSLNRPQHPSSRSSLQKRSSSSEVTRRCRLHSVGSSWRSVNDCLQHSGRSSRRSNRRPSSGSSCCKARGSSQPCMILIATFQIGTCCPAASAVSPHPRRRMQRARRMGGASLQSR